MYMKRVLTADVTNAIRIKQHPGTRRTVLPYTHAVRHRRTACLRGRLSVTVKQRSVAKASVAGMGLESHVSAQNGAAVSGISNIEAARMHEQHDCCAARPGAFPGSRPAHPPYTLRPLLILHAQQLPVNILAGSAMCLGILASRERQ